MLNWIWIAIIAVSGVMFAWALLATSMAALVADHFVAAERE